MLTTSDASPTKNAEFKSSHSSGILPVLLRSETRPSWRGAHSVWGQGSIYSVAVDLRGHIIVSESPTSSSVCNILVPGSSPGTCRTHPHYSRSPCIRRFKICASQCFSPLSDVAFPKLPASISVQSMVRKPLSRVSLPLESNSTFGTLTSPLLLFSASDDSVSAFR